MMNKIDYTTLTGSETPEKIMEICEKAEELGVASVCVYPKFVNIVRNCLEDSNVKVCTVISFPNGDDETIAKVYETMEALVDGADEIDMVFNYKLFLDNIISDDDSNIELNQEIDLKLFDDVATLVEVVHAADKKLKVIIESGLLTVNQTKFITDMVVHAGADFIKTSTGKVKVGAELEKVKAMKEVIDELKSNMKIKASGGIRNINDMKIFDEYVDRFGMGYGAVDSIYSDMKK